MLIDERNRHNRNCLINIISDILNANSKNCELYIFGSSSNGIGFLDSDIDVYAHVPIQNENSDKAKSNPLENIQKQLKRAFRQYYFVKFIHSKKCPIVKLIPLQPGINSRSKRVNYPNPRELYTVDINLTHKMGVFNTCVLKHLICENSVIHQLTVILKLWAKKNSLISTVCFTSYSIVIMIIFFLQNCDTPLVCKSFQELIDFSAKFMSSFPSIEYEEEIQAKCRKMISSRFCSLSFLLTCFFK